MDQDSAYMVAASKEVIENGNKPPVTVVVEGVETIIAPATTKEKAQRRLELKAKSTLLMGIPNEHQLKFNSIKDAKSLLQAIKKRFGGNAATKKTQKNLLKQQYKNFTASSSKIAMLTVKAKRFLKNTGMKLNLNGNETVSFDKTKVECYNFHKRDHFARECREPRAQDNQNRESIRRNMSIENTNSSALVSCDGLGGYDWSNKAKDGPTNFALMAYSTLKEFEKESKIGEHTFKKHVVETGEAKASAVKPKDVRKNFGPLIIKDWISDSEDEADSRPKIEKKTVKPSFAKIEFVKSKE
nr:ribonuclease H-like domain-containing protein [Tanacetum cinerariifolium]